MVLQVAILRDAAERPLLRINASLGLCLMHDAYCAAIAAPFILHESSATWC